MRWVHLSTFLSFLTIKASGSSPTVELKQGYVNIPPFPQRINQLAYPNPPPYNNIVKNFSGVTSVSDCEAKCLSYRNPDADMLTGWHLCQSFTFLKATTSNDNHSCFVIVDSDLWLPKLSSAGTTGKVVWPPKSCHADADCSYNGQCHNHTCHCRQGWFGDRCHRLNLLPTTRHAGYRGVDNGTNTSSWGGSVLLDRSTGYSHMWSSEMMMHCGIDSWTTNSHIIHAVAKDGINFVRTGEVQPSFSHEVNVVRVPTTGDWVMYFTGTAPGHQAPQLCTNCSNGNTHDCRGGDPSYPSSVSYMSFAKSPMGPWSKRAPLFMDPLQSKNLHGDTNLAMTILPNNSAVGLLRVIVSQPLVVAIHAVTADDWRNPSSYIGHWNEIQFANVSWGPEDPMLYVDKNGIYHVVFHNQLVGDDERLCGSHAYSLDGLNWVLTGTAWSNTVLFTDGTDYTFTRRERPHLLFTDMIDSDRITGLTSGVQYGPSSPVTGPGEDACYTIYQPVGK